MRLSRIGTFSQWLQRTSRWCLRTTSTPASDSGALVAIRFLSNCVECDTSILHVTDERPCHHERSCHSAERGQNANAHPRSASDRRDGRHEEKVDRYRGNDLPIRTVDTVQGEERIADRDIGFDEADPVV